MRGIVSNIIASASLAIAGGIYLGYSTIAGASADYGATRSPDDSRDDTIAGAAAAFDCVGCTDNELGFEWAASRKIRGETGCDEGSWAFRQGCLDFARNPDQPV